MPPGEEKKPLLQRLLPNSMDSVVPQAPDITRSGFATEAPPTNTDEYESSIRGGTPGVSGGEKAGGHPVTGKFLKKPPEQIGTIKGRIDVPRPEDEAALYAQAERNVFEAEQRAAIAEGAAMGFSEQVLSDYANIAHMDALEGRRIHQEHFTKAKTRMDRLYKNVEDASAMKVNPYNWHESVGRGGRVAAAFSLLTGQMAAGAGNPNSALKMMEAAIERDIAAQEQNIKIKFDALKMQRGLAQDERQLYQEEINSLNETRAIAYSAITGRIAAAKQHAINEAHYAAIEVMEDHFNMKKLDAIQAARQAIFVEVEQGTDAAKLRMQLRQVEQMRSQLIPGAPLQGAPAGQAGAMQAQQNAAVETSTRAVKPAPGRAGAVRGRTGSRAPPATPPTSRVQSVDAPPPAVPATATPRMIEDMDTGMSRMQTQEEADREFTEKQKMEREAKGAREKRPRTMQDLGRKAYHGAPVTEEEVANVITKSRRAGGADISKEVADAGGFGLAYQLKITGEGTAKTTSIAEALNDIAAGKPIRNGGLLMNQDADLVSLMAPEPDERLYPKELIERNGEMVRVHGADYYIAHKAWEYGREFEEIYETRATVDNQRNTVVAGGMSYKLAEGSVARTNEKEYILMRDKVAEVATGMKSMKQLAEGIRTHGLSGMFTPEGGINIPGFNTADEFTMTLDNKMITASMQFIKKHDPTARISDKDLDVGRQAMGNFLTRGGTIIDFMQSLDGDSMNNTKRRQIENFLVSVIAESQRMLFEKYENELVPDYNTSMKVAEDAREMQKFIDRKRDN